MRTNRIIIRLKIYIQKFINRGKANNLGHSFTYMGKVSTKLNISHKSLLVVSLGLVTGELYLLDLKIYINVSFILSGLNRPVLTNKALSSVISFPFFTFKYNTFPPSPICNNFVRLLHTKWHPTIPHALRSMTKVYFYFI